VTYINKKILIFGFGVTGQSAWNYLSKRKKTNLYVYDDHLDYKTKPNLVKFNIEYIQKLDYVIVSPGIPFIHPLIKKITNQYHNVEILSDIDLFFLLNKTKEFIGVTGTNGKSTVVSLINHLLLNLNKKSTVCGNIGVPIFDLMGKDYDIFVIELSSYHLEIIKYLKLKIALITNITPDHLERHGNMYNYIKIKKRIIAIGEKVIINIDDKNLADEYGDNIYTISCKDILNNVMSYIDNTIYYNGTIIVNDYNNEKRLSHINILSSILSIICYTKKSNKDFIVKLLNLILSFKILPHRQEFVKKWNNILFINDSKATNIEATQNATEQYHNIILLMGGQLKAQSDLSILKFYNIKKIYLFGDAKDILFNFFKNKIDCQMVDSMKKALEDAIIFANNSNYTILLSPACASFDQYKNFEERGDVFKSLIFQLIKL